MTDATPTARYQRILVKLSGEALLGNEDYGVDPAMLKRIAGEIRDISQMGVQVAVVLGGGNIFRGAGLARAGMDRVTADHMGMLATVINALALQDALESQGTYARGRSRVCCGAARHGALAQRFCCNMADTPKGVCDPAFVPGV